MVMHILRRHSCHIERILLGITSVDFNATGRLLIIYSTFIEYLKNKWEYNEAVHQLFIGFKKVYDSFRREILYIFSLLLTEPATLLSEWIPNTILL
jgi:hypothetical protein